MQIRAENLVVCRGSNYFRIVIPQDLRPRFERREFRRRIPDCALRNAISIANFLRERLQSLFRSARRGMLTDDQIKRMADFHLDAMLSEDDNARLDEERKDEAQIGNELNLTSELLDLSKHELASNNLSSVSEDADLLIKFFKIDQETASPSRKKLCLELLRRNVQRFEIEMKRVAGEHVELPTFSHKNQVQSETASSSLDIKAPKSLKERIERWPIH